MLTQRLEDIMDRWIGAGCITSPEALSERITEAKRKESQLLGIDSNGRSPERQSERSEG
jgi:hypothetical protein